jgi:small subunit ribosomal protein S8
MMTTDPIADMLTRIRNADLARHDFTLVPVSNIKLSIAKILKEEGFIDNYEVLRGDAQRMIKIYLKYTDKKQPVISGLKIPRVYGGLGIAIVSTPKGLMVGQQAWRQRVGGELLCYIW